jgi:hypothetical protein
LQHRNLVYPGIRRVPNTESIQTTNNSSIYKNPMPILNNCINNGRQKGNCKTLSVIYKQLQLIFYELCLRTIRVQRYDPQLRQCTQNLLLSTHSDNNTIICFKEQHQRQTRIHCAKANSTFVIMDDCQLSVMITHKSN